MNVVLPCMTSEKGENSKFGVNIYYNQFCIYQTILSTPLRSMTKNLSNPVVYLEPCQTSKIERFVNIIIFFLKHSMLDVWQNSKYTSVICYSLFGKIEGTNKKNWFTCNVNLLILKFKHNYVLHLTLSKTIKIETECI